MTKLSKWYDDENGVYTRDTWTIPEVGTRIMKWIKSHKQLYVSECGKYALSGRYTYYQGWIPFYLPAGIKGSWTALDGQHAGKGALETCRAICSTHNSKVTTIKRMKEMISEHREARFWNEEKTASTDNAFWAGFKTMYESLDDDGRYEIDNWIV